MNDTYNPDVLSCLANLSNDEVFTPPAVVNQMLDLLPPELFRDSSTTFLDIGCKSGVFLREIAKRLIAGLAEEIPDLQTRVDHILHRQVFGIATTELTSLVARRTLYCSKYPNCRYSASRFETVEGNIRFRNIPHEFVNGRCKWCGASEEQFGAAKRKGLETHAYEFIHTNHPEEIFNMKFDVIVGNPPYQLSDGGNAASAMPIYHKFVEQAQRLNPRYLIMIVPARWYVGGRGLDQFRAKMLTDKRIRVLHDFPCAEDCFPGVEIKGGVCFWLWCRDNEGVCRVWTHNGEDVEYSERYLLEEGMDTFVRTAKDVSILNKVRKNEMSSLFKHINAGRHFGFHTLVTWQGEEGTLQTADGTSSYPIRKMKHGSYDIKVYISHGECWIKRSDVFKHAEDVDKYKVLIPRSGNPGSTVIGKLRISEPATCSSNTFNVMVCTDRHEAINVISYLQTKFARYLVSLRTTTQETPPKAFAFVPMQDFSKPWTDAELYAKYKLTDDEIAFIESMIKPME